MYIYSILNLVQIILGYFSVDIVGSKNRLSLFGSHDLNFNLSDAVILSDVPHPPTIYEDLDSARNKMLSTCCQTELISLKHAFSLPTLEIVVEED